MCTHVFKERCTYTRNVAYDHVMCLEREKKESRGGGWRERRERDSRAGDEAQGQLRPLLGHLQNARALSVGVSPPCGPV